MNEDLAKAVAFHNQGHHDKALQYYRKCLSSDPKCSPLLYQNYGALLRSNSKQKESRQIYNDGLKLFPGNVGILTNLANLLRDEAPTISISLYLKVIRLRTKHNDFKKANDIVYSLLTLLSEIGCNVWAFRICIYWIKYVKASPQMILHLASLVSDQLPSSTHLALLNSLSNLDSELSLSEKSELHFCLALMYLSTGDYSLSDASYKHAMSCIQQDCSADIDKKQQTIIVGSWNYSNILLKHQYFERGWRLYDYGLVSPANGKQRWQRCLAKPFSYNELALWRGECLAGKRLLVLDEQAIGDGMQFLSLLDSLISEAGHLDLLLSDRLIPIYNRSFAASIASGKLTIWSRKFAIENKLPLEKIDFQTPLGSICRHRFTDIATYSPTVPVLYANTDLAAQLRSKYLSQSKSSVSQIVGISWRGGPKGARMKRKSVSVSEFSSIFSIEDTLFISLQYGQSKPIVDRWVADGHNVIHDDTIDPLKDMDNWLSQVSACDAVVSVANTTIHGAGGLNIPTMCLLSEDPDWRWFVDPNVQRSYWYPSVGIARQVDGSWQTALQKATSWVADGCPRPTGSISTI